MGVRRLAAHRFALLAATALLAASCAHLEVAPAPAPDETAPVARDTTHVKRGHAPGAAREFQLGMWTPALAPPRLDSLRRVTWRPAPAWSADRSRLLGRLDRGQDTLTAWRAEATDSTPLRPFLLSRIARIELASGDTARAAQDLDALRRLPGPWQWEALRTLSDLALAHGDTRGADALLAAASPSGWTDTERAAWSVRRAKLRADLADTTTAAQLARSTLRRSPGAAPATTAVRLLETFAAARGKPLGVDDEILAAEVDRLQAHSDDAARRLTRAEAASPATERPRIALRLSDLYRDARRFNDGLAAAQRAATHTKDPELRARASLARARLLRDSDRADEGIAEYQRLAHSSSAPADVRATAAFELGLELEAAHRYPAARDAYGLVVELAGARRDEARLRRGLLWVAEGDAARGTAEWGDASGESYEFWRAVLGRADHRERSDSALRAIASRVGYSFYRAAARETLGLTGWTGATPAAPSPDVADTATLDLAQRLTAIGETTDAMLALQRWIAVPPDSSSGMSAGSALEAARIAYAMGRTPTGIRLAQKALDASPRASLEPWTVIPWLYPAAFDSLYASLPRRADSSGIDVETLRAVAWQESRFDPAARSRSNALGLYQLKLATAGDVARRLHEPPPTEAALLDPARSLRFGHDYLKWLLSRTGGDLVVALAAYNSGPGALPPDWRTWVQRGGDALFCELIGRAETRDYVRLILGARQAYRELATPPTAP